MNSTCTPTSNFAKIPRLKFLNSERRTKILMRHLINNTYDLFELMKSKVKLFFYATKTPLDIKGYFETTVESGNKITFATAIDWAY